MDLVIGTDQNLDLLKVNEHNPTSEFLELNLTEGLLPMISKPTRITHKSSTLIDNIYVKDKVAFQSTGAILVTDISDHLPCLLLLDKDIIVSGPQKVMKRKITDNTLQNINETLSLICLLYTSPSPRDS